jgi:hypothetical protein
VGTTPSFAKKPFVSSILLWMRTDQPRQAGMDYRTRIRDPRTSPSPRGMPRHPAPSAVTTCCHDARKPAWLQGSLPEL